MELAVSTIVIIVISILVLVAILIIWNNQTGIFSDFLRNLAGKTNVDAVVTGCNTLASQNSVYEFCCVGRMVKHEEEEKIIEEELTCLELVDKEFTSGRINKLNCENVCE